MIIEAEISDATHLVLRSPLAMPVGSRLALELVDTEQISEHDEMVAASGGLLEMAYGPEEPDYSEAGDPLQ